MFKFGYLSCTASRKTPVRAAHNKVFPSADHINSFDKFIISLRGRGECHTPYTSLDKPPDLLLKCQGSQFTFLKSRSLIFISAEYTHVQKFQPCTSGRYYDQDLNDHIRAIFILPTL